MEKKILRPMNVETALSIVLEMAYNYYEEYVRPDPKNKKPCVEGEALDIVEYQLKKLRVEGLTRILSEKTKNE